MVHAFSWRFGRTCKTCWSSAEQRISQSTLSAGPNEPSLIFPHCMSRLREHITGRQKITEGAQRSDASGGLGGWHKCTLYSSDQSQSCRIYRTFCFMITLAYRFFERRRRPYRAALSSCVRTFGQSSQRMSPSRRTGQLKARPHSMSSSSERQFDLLSTPCFRVTRRPRQYYPPR